MIGQAKEIVAFYVKSENNVANLLTKFDLNEQSVEHWYGLQEKIFYPPLFNIHPNKLFSKLLNIS